MQATIHKPGANFQFGQTKKWQQYAIIAGLFAMIFACDLSTSSAIPLNLYYALPIALSAILLDRRFTYLLIVLSALAAVYVLSGVFQDDFYYYFASNFVQSLLGYALIEIGIHKGREKHHRAEKKIARLNAELEQARQRLDFATSTYHVLYKGASGNATVIRLGNEEKLPGRKDRAD